MWNLLIITKTNTKFNINFTLGLYHCVAKITGITVRRDDMLLEHKRPKRSRGQSRLSQAGNTYLIKAEMKTRGTMHYPPTPPPTPSKNKHHSCACLILSFGKRPSPPIKNTQATNNKKKQNIYKLTAGRCSDVCVCDSLAVQGAMRKTCSNQRVYARINKSVPRGRRAALD